MIKNYTSMMFKSAPIIFDHQFKLSDYNVNGEEVKKYYLDLHNEKARRTRDFVLGSLGEFVVGLWLMQNFDYPDIIPNEDNFTTDLNYRKRDPGLVNFHVKTVEMTAPTLTGMINLEGKSNELINDQDIIDNDVLVLVKYSTSYHIAEVSTTCPVRFVEWKAPISSARIGKNLAVYNDDIIVHPKTIDFSSYFKTNSKIIEQPKIKPKPISYFMKRTGGDVGPY